MVDGEESSADEPPEGEDGESEEWYDGDASGPSDWHDGEPSDPADVLALVGDETRLSILRELAKSRRTNWQFDGLEFAELRRAVGVRDSGQFNYHLGELLGEFVVEHGDEYVLTNRGMEVVGAIESGAYTGPGEPRRRETEYECPNDECDEHLEALYSHQYFRLQCPEYHYNEGESLPPRVAGNATLAELQDIAITWSRQTIERARAGVCRHCWGPMEATVPVRTMDGPDHFDPEMPDDAVLVRFECTDCGMLWTIPAGLCVVNHPAVISLYHEHDRDPRREPAASLPFAAATHPEVESTDPVRVRVDVAVEGDEVSLWLDAETEIVEYERT